MIQSTHWEGCHEVHPECRNMGEKRLDDWAGHAISAQRHFRKVDELLTNAPPAQKLSDETREAVIEELQACVVEIDRIAAWVRAH